jgi:hypothetical protein
MEGACFCPLGEFAQSVPRSTLALFADDYDALATGARAPRPSVTEAVAKGTP